MTCARSHSTAARQGARAALPGAAAWSPGLVKEKEGAGLRLPGRERSLTSSDHVIGGDAGPRSHRAVLHDLISWLSPSAAPGAWNQYLLAGPEAPCLPVAPPGGPPQRHMDPPPASRSQAGSQGRSRAAGDPETVKGRRPVLLPSGPLGLRSLPVGGGGLCANPDPAPISCPGGTHGHLGALGLCMSMRVMDPAYREAVEFHRPTRHLANSRRSVNAPFGPWLFSH